MKNYIIAYTNLVDNNTEIFFVKAPFWRDAILESVEVRNLPDSIEKIKNCLPEVFEHRHPATREEAVSIYRRGISEYIPESLEKIKEYYFNRDSLIEVIEFTGIEMFTYFILSGSFSKQY